MHSTVPADLLIKVKTRSDAWRATRKYPRQPIPAEFCQAALKMIPRHSSPTEQGRMAFVARSEPRRDTLFTRR